MEVKKESDAKNGQNNQKSYKIFHRQNHFSNFEFMREKDQLCDVTITANGKKYAAHKIILAAAFGYFHKLFVGDDKDKEKNTISLTEIDATNVEPIIKFSYTGQIKITDINVLTLLRDAEFLDEVDIRDACMEFLKESYLNSETALQVYRLSDDLNSIFLKEASKNMISRHITRIAETKEFLKLKIDALKDILSENKLSYEKEFFEATIKWIMHDAVKRRSHLKALISYIQFSVLTSDYLVSYLVKTVPSNYCDIIGEIISLSGNLAKSSENRIIIIDKQKPHQIQVYNLRTDKWCSSDWEIARSMVPHENEFGCTVLNNKLYLVGGRNESGDFAIDTTVYDPTTRFLKQLSKLNYARCDPAVCSLNGYLYACGGWNKQGVLNEVERYDPATNKWEILPHMKHPRSDAAAVAFDDCIYVIGGCNRAAGALDSVEWYNPSTNQWTILDAYMQQGRAALGAAVLDGKIYVCGGDLAEVARKYSTVEVYDPKVKKWQYVASMQEIRLRFVLLAHGKQLYAIGGIANSTMETYDPHIDTWSFLSSSDMPVKGLAGGLIKL